MNTGDQAKNDAMRVGNTLRAAPGKALPCNVNILLLVVRALICVYIISVMITLISVVVYNNVYTMFSLTSPLSFRTCLY